MALTAEQETRRQELLSKQQAPPQISPEQESRRQELLNKQNANIKQQQMSGLLIDQIQQSRSALKKRETIFGVTSDPQARRLTAEAQQANQKLLDTGFSQNQINLTIDVKNRLDPIKIGRPVGGLAGSIAVAAAIPGPIDDIALASALLISAGAGLGGVAGEAAQTGLEEKRLISKREALSAFATESLTEFGGRGLVRAGKFVFSPIIKKLVPEAAALVDDFAKVGGTFSPSELDDRFTIRIAESFSRGSFGAKKIFQDFEEKQGRAVGIFAENIVDSIGQGVARQTPEEIGQAFADGITRPGGRIMNLFDDLVNPLYKQVDELSVGVSVPTKGLKVFAQKKIAIDDRLSELFLSPTGRSKLNKILALPDNISFSDMRILRSSFLKDVQKMARDVDQSQGIIKQLAGITDDAIFTPKATKGLSKEGLNLLRNTNALYKAGKEGINKTFSEKLVKRLLRNPSSVVRELFPNNSPKSIRLLRKSLVEPIGGKPSKEGKILWNQLRQAWLADAVDEATKLGVANPRVFDNIIRKSGASLKEMFPDDIGGVRKIQSLMQQAGKGPPSGTSLFSRGAQATGVVMMYNSGKDGDFIGFTVGGVLAVGPLAFAKLATNPKGVKFLTAGLNLKPGATGLVPNAVRMIRVIREINRKEQQPALQAERKKRAKIGHRQLRRDLPIIPFAQ